MVNVLEYIIYLEGIIILKFNWIGMVKGTPRIQWSLLCLNHTVIIGIIWDIFAETLESNYGLYISQNICHFFPCEEVSRIQDINWMGHLIIFLMSLNFDVVGFFVDDIEDFE